MTLDEAKRLAAEARECPFCGERLVLTANGETYWLKHPKAVGGCFGSAFPIASRTNLTAWNTRAPSEREKQLAAALQEIVANDPLALYGIAPPDCLETVREIARAALKGKP